MKKRVKSSHLLRGIIYFVIVIVVAYFAYSIYTYYRTGVSGIVVCNPDGECIATGNDIHAYLDVEICGIKTYFPLEAGSVEGQHTHKERNKLHWHSKLSIDEKTGEILDKEAMKIGNFFDSIDYRFTKSCIGDYCNGDRCAGGEEGKLRMWVNGKETKAMREYSWKDDDEIKIVFGGENG